MSEEAAAKWIDECGLAPPAGKVLTGYNPLPEPPTLLSPSPVDEQAPAIDDSKEDVVKVEARAESHSTDNRSSQSSQNSSPPSSRTSKSISTSYTSLPSSPEALQNSRPLVFNQSLLNSDPSPLIRIHSLPYLDGESIMTQIMQDHGLSEKPESYAIYQDTRKPPSKSGFILLSFGSKMAARLAVVHLKLQLREFLRALLPAFAPLDISCRFRRSKHRARDRLSRTSNSHFQKTSALSRIVEEQCS